MVAVEVYTRYMLRKKNALRKKDIDWQKKIIKKVKLDKVELNHPQGKERFEKVINNLKKLVK